MDNQNDWQSPPAATIYDPEDIAKNKGISMAAYLGILFFLPLVCCPDSAYGRFHANQGLVLFLFCLLGNFAFRYIPLIGGAVTWLYSVLMFVLLIIGMVNAYNGKAEPLPVIGTIRILK